MNAAPVMDFVEVPKEKAKRKRNNKIRNVILRDNGVYYFDATIDGRRYFESLDTRDKPIAGERARVKRDAIKNGKWDALDNTRVKRQSPSGKKSRGGKISAVPIASR